MTLLLCHLWVSVWALQAGANGQITCVRVRLPVSMQVAPYQF